MITPIIDSGHGFDTMGKRSKGFYFSNGKVELKENCVNEAVCNKLSALFDFTGKEAHFISQEWYDISLSERVRRERLIAKKIKAKGGKSFFMSIHADAFHVKNGATGGRFFYKSESGRLLAEHFTDYLSSNGYEIRLREPKKANFKVIRETSSPAVLFEMGFMTSRADLDLLKKDSFRNNTARLLYEASILL